MNHRTQVTYWGVIHMGDEGTLGVSFPDFPSCISAANTVEEAMSAAQESLQLHIDGLEADGEEIPKPSDHKPIIREVARGQAFFAVPIKVMAPIACDSRRKRILMVDADGADDVCVGILERMLVMARAGQLNWVCVAATMENGDYVLSLKHDAPDILCSVGALEHLKRRLLEGINPY